MASESTTLIVGIGSAHGDDQIGWLVADQVRAMLSDSPVLHRTEVHNAKSPLDLLNWLGEYGNNRFHRLLICDACHGLGETGSIRRWIWPTDELQDHRFSGTHDFGLAATLQLAEQLGRLPPVLVIWGIQLDQIQPGSQLSDPLRKIPRSLAQEMLRWEPELEVHKSPFGKALES